MKPDSKPQTDGRVGSLVGWAVLTVASLLWILVLEYLHPRIVLALQRSGEWVSLPAGFQLLLGGYRILWLLPVVAAIAGVFCLKCRLFRKVWFVAGTAAMFLILYLLALALMSVHFLGINASFAGGRFENRLPDLGAEIVSNLTSVVVYQLATVSDGELGEFRGHSALFRTELSGADRLRAVNALLDDIHASDGRAGMCFDPKHGVTVRSSTGQLDILICFACRKLEYWVGSENDRLGIKTNSRALFDDLLSKDIRKESTPSAR